MFIKKKKKRLDIISLNAAYCRYVCVNGVLETTFDTVCFKQTISD